MKKKIILIILLLLSVNLFAEEQSDNIPLDVPLWVINFQPIPAINLFAPFIKTNDIFLLGTFMGIGYELSGLALSPVASINTGHANGIQMAGLFNVSIENMYGSQMSGLFNLSAKDMYGVQLSLGLNIAQGDMRGIQLAPINIRDEGDGINVMIGLINVSKSPNVIPIGLINNIETGEKHFYAFMDDSAFINAGFRSGSKRFHSDIGYGFGGGLIPGKEGDNLILPRGGFGFEYSINNLYFDLDFLRGNIKKLNDFTFKDIFLFFFGSNTEIYQIRLKTGYNFHEHFGIFGGISLDHLIRKKTSDPSPEELGGLIIGKWNDNNSLTKIGFFGGLQF